MRVDIIVPKFDKSSDSITLSSWYKKPGEKVLKGEIIADAETDTISCGITASFDCILSKIIVPEGYEIDAGTKIAVIEKDLDVDTSKMQEESDAAIEEYKKTHKKPQEEIESIKEIPVAQMVAKSEPKIEEHTKDSSKQEDNKKVELSKAEDSVKNRTAKLSEAMKNSIANSNNIGVNTYKPLELNKKSEASKKIEQKTEIKTPKLKPLVPKVEENIQKVETPSVRPNVGEAKTPLSDVSKRTKYKESNPLDDRLLAQEVYKINSKEEKIEQKEKTLAMLELGQKIAVKANIGKVKKSEEDLKENRTLEDPAEIKFDPSLYEANLPKSLFLRHSKDVYEDEDDEEAEDINVKKNSFQKATGFISKLFHAIQESFFDPDTNITFERATLQGENSIGNSRNLIGNSISQIANDDASVIKDQYESYSSNLKIQQIAAGADKILKTKNSRVDDILIEDVERIPKSNKKVESYFKAESRLKEDLNPENIQKHETSLKSTLLSKFGIHKKSKSILSNFGIKKDEEPNTSLLSDLGLKPEDGLKVETQSYKVVDTDSVVEKVIAEKVEDDIIVNDPKVIKSTSDEDMVSTKVNNEIIVQKSSRVQTSQNEFEMPKMRAVRYVKDDNTKISKDDLDKSLEENHILEEVKDLGVKVKTTLNTEEAKDVSKALEEETKSFGTNVERIPNVETKVSKALEEGVKTSDVNVIKNTLKSDERSQVINKFEPKTLLEKGNNENSSRKLKKDSQVLGVKADEKDLKNEIKIGPFETYKEVYADSQKEKDKKDGAYKIKSNEEFQQKIEKISEKVIEKTKKTQEENVIDKVLSKAAQNTNQFLGTPIKRDIISWRPQGGKPAEIRTRDESVGGNMENDFDNKNALNEAKYSNDTKDKLANILKEAEKNANEEANKLKDDILTRAHEEALSQAEELKNKIFQEYEELAMKEANDMRNKIVQGSISEAENTKQELINEAVSKAYEEANSIRQQIFSQANKEAKTQSLASLNEALIEARELAKDRANKLSKEIIQKALNESKFEAREIKKDVIHSATKYAARESENIIKNTMKKAKLEARIEAEKIIDSAIQLTSSEVEKVVHETIYKAKEKSETRCQEIVEKMSYKALKEAEKLVEDTLLMTKTRTEKMTQDIIDSVKHTALQESKEILTKTIEKAKEDSKAIGKDVIDSISKLATKEAETFIKDTILKAKAKSEESGNKIISDISEQATKEAEQIIKYAMERARKYTEYKANEIVNSISNVATYKAEEIANKMIEKAKENSERKGEEVVNLAKNKAKVESDRIMLENINKIKFETQQKADEVVLSVKKQAEEEAKAIVLDAMSKVRLESQEKGKKIIESIEGATYQEAQSVASESVARVKIQSKLTGERILSSIEDATREEAEKIVIEGLKNAKERSLSTGEELVNLIKEEARKGAKEIVMESLKKIKENSKLTSENARALIEDRMKKEAEELIQHSLKNIQNKAYEIEGASDSLQRHATKTISGILEDTLLKIKIQADDLEEAFCESTQNAMSSIADLASNGAKNILKDALGKSQNHYDKRAKTVIDSLSINKHLIKDNNQQKAEKEKGEQSQESLGNTPKSLEESKILKDEPLDILLGSLTQRFHDQAQDLLDDYKNHAANSAYKEGILTKDKLDEYTEKVREEAQRKSKETESIEQTEKLHGGPTVNGYCIPGNNETCNNCTANKFGECISNNEASIIQKLMNTAENEGSPDMYADNWNKPQGFDTPTDEKVKIDEFRQRIYENRKNFIDPSVIATMSEEVDMSSVLALSKSFGEQFSEKYNTRLGFTPFFISGAISALKKYKMFNANINDDTIVYKNTYDISIITCGNDGLLAPVLRHADSMSIADIEKAMITLSKRAINGELTLEEVSGGTFTVVNAGIYGSTLGSDLLTPPQVATLSVHKMHERPVATKNGIEVRPILYISLSYDQRVADKKLAYEFLNTVKGYVENPGWHSLGL